MLKIVGGELTRMSTLAVAVALLSVADMMSVYQSSFNLGNNLVRKINIKQLNPD